MENIKKQKSVNPYGPSLDLRPTSLLAIAMSGRKVVDIAGILRASRGIAANHVELRRQQFNSYRKTSSLWKALEGRNEHSFYHHGTRSGPFYDRGGSKHPYSTTSKSFPTDTSIPRVASVAESDATRAQKESLEQDHFYEKSNQNTTADPVPSSALSVEQEKAKRRPLPDGSIPPLFKDSSIGSSSFTDAPSPKFSNQLPTQDIAEADLARVAQRQAEAPIPSLGAEPPPQSSFQVNSASPEDAEINVEQRQDVFYSPSSDVKPVLSSLPRVKLPKVHANAQEGDEHVPEAGINQDVFYSSQSDPHGASSSVAQAIPKQEGLDDEIYSELFHSPKVARMLQRKPQMRSGRNDIELQRPGEATPQQMKHPTASDQETYSTRAVPSEADDEVKLGTDIAKDAANLSGKGSVSVPITC